MDPARFDTFIRALTQCTSEIPSRRALLHALGGLLAAGALTASDSDAKRKKKQKKCKGGKKKCAGGCVDPRTDRGNCGSCGKVCGNDELCQGGACLENGPCPVNQARCDGQCVDVYTEPTNCGGCGNTCAANEICLSGDCCRPHGQICVSNGQCCSAFCGDVDEVKPTGQVCYLPGFSRRCCALTDEACLDSCDCCGDLLCHNQRCCWGAGTPCIGDGDCCSFACNTDVYPPVCV